MTGDTRSTQPLAIIDTRGRRGFLERALFGPDETTDQNARWHQRVPGPQTPGMVSAMTLSIGLWLVAGPFVPADVEFDGGGSRIRLDLVVGCGLVALGLLRSTRPIRVLHATVTGCLLGAILVTAPLVIEYGLVSDSTMAVVNDVAAGVAVIAVTIVGFIDARRRGGFDA